MRNDNQKVIFILMSDNRKIFSKKRDFLFFDLPKKQLPYQTFPAYCCQSFEHQYSSFVYRNQVILVNLTVSL